MSFIKIEYGVLLICFGLYYVLSYAARLYGFRNLNEALDNVIRMRWLNLKHMAGIIVLLLVPLIFFSNYSTLLVSASGSSWKIFLVFLLLAVFACLVAYRSASRAEINDISAASIGQNGIWAYFVNRVVFLSAYEFYFRGVVLYELIHHFGLIPGVLITTSSYVLMHAFDTKEEIIGAIPFGIILSLLSYFGSLWMAIGLHLTLSLTYELTIYKRCRGFKTIRI